MLLHACCAPCSIYALQYWREQGIEPVLYYFSPNIHPYAEYLKRREELLKLEKDDDVRLLVADEYPLREFFSAALASEKRCDACYRLRLEQTARQAVILEEREFSTTLLISPYQQHEKIAELGEEIAIQHGLSFRYADLRPGFRASQNEARQREYYRQKYCGCVFSELERYRSD